MSAVVTFYHFVGLDEAQLADLRAGLVERCSARDIVGTTLLATEGINGTLAGARPKLDEVVAWLRGQPGLAELPVKFSQASATSPVFYRLRVKIKPEIVTFGVPVAPGERTGQHVDAERWNELLDDPDLVVIDTRNHYEIEVGSFPGALNPNTESFREFPQFVADQLDPQQQPRIAMFCTGGIRCEKASAYMLEAGFSEVYQLDGGILKYLETVAEPANRWQGDCFVFDQRVALKADLAPGEHVQCHACRRPLTQADVNNPHYEEGVSCRFCFDASPKRRAAHAERQKQIDLARSRGQVHLGPKSQVAHRQTEQRRKPSDSDQ